MKNNQSVENIFYKKNNNSIIVVILILITCFLFSCQSDNSQNISVTNSNKKNSTTKFSLLSSAETGINFTNKITETDKNNYFNYNYFYNGAGVAIGDINNDNLPDIYFGGNQVENKLYLNKGNLKFEDISVSAKVNSMSGWTTGVSFIDINQDGLQDIYVCRAGPTTDPALLRNLLYINKGNNQFEESAIKFGLGDTGYSTQAYFWDYDKDGDLDVYIVNHRTDFKNNGKISSNISNDIKQEFSDQLYQNNNGKFKNVTKEAGITNKNWGLSASISDFNADGWPDIYVANDFLEPDVLYINNKNGTFSKGTRKQFKHISFYGMGSDVGDINNDGLMDLIVLDMVSEDHIRSKRNMAAMSTKDFRSMVEVGYHHQYMHNTLQLNKGNGIYSEIANMAGISRTDWSWAPLFADFDNDGYQDLFISNGIKRDVTDNDGQTKLKELSQNGSMTLDIALGSMPANKIHNYIFKNNGDLTFTKQHQQWGFDQNINTNGAAYADLDNDGDLDLVLNNMDIKSNIYQNNSNNNWIKFNLKGDKNNSTALGSIVKVYLEGEILSRINLRNRGFMSSIYDPLHFGLGNKSNVDSVEITWPDGTITLHKQCEINNTNRIEKTADVVQQKIFQKTPFTPINTNLIGLNFRHLENNYDDFKKEILLPHRYSELGPCIAKADVNGDGYEDVYIGGAMNQVGQLYIQKRKKFQKKNIISFENDKKHEDTGAEFFDFDNDGDLDLLVTSGGNEMANNNTYYQDRLYINDGKGNFKSVKNVFSNHTNSTKAIAIGDVDKDGDLDIFIGGRISPRNYPFSPKSELLINNNSNKNQSKSLFKNTQSDIFNNIGMITDAAFIDIDKDGDLDLLVSGEWMPITTFENNDGTFKKGETFEDSESGWFQSLFIQDINGDNIPDIIAGNIGLNNKFHPSISKPLHVYAHDFDDNGSIDIVLSKTKNNKVLLPVRGRECSSQQMPFIKNKFPDFTSFAEANLQEIYGDKLNDALHLEVNSFAHIAWISNNKGGYDKIKLPNSTQTHPITDIVSIKTKNQENLLILSGNMYGTEVETTRYDAGFGSILNYKNDEFQAISNLESGLYLYGDSRQLETIKMINNNLLLSITNNDIIQIYSY